MPNVAQIGMPFGLTGEFGHFFVVIVVLITE
jgi:hypothetical protein